MKVILPILLMFFLLAIITAGGFLAVKTRSSGNLVRSAFASSAEGQPLPLHRPVRSSEPKEIWPRFEPNYPVSSAALDRDRLVLIENDKKTTYLAAVNISDGKQLWEEDLGMVFSGTATIMGDTAMLVGSENDGNKSAGLVMSFDLGNHTRKWRKDLNGTNAYPIGTSEGHLFVASSDARSTDIVSYAPGSDEQVFSRNFSTPSYYLGRSSLYVLEDETITAYDTHTKESRWHVGAAKSAVLTEVGGYLLEAPTTDKSDQGQIVAYDTREGKKQWETTVKSDRISGIGALNDDIALVSVGDRIIGVNLADKGSQKFSSRLLNGAKILPSGSFIGVTEGSTAGSDTTSGTVPRAGSTSGSANGKIVVFDPDKGEPVQTISTRQSVGDFAVADGVAYIYDGTENRYVAYDTATGEKLWKYNPKDDNDEKSLWTQKGIVAVDGGVLVFTSKGVTRLGD